MAIIYSIPEHHNVHVPWILFGIALSVNLGFIIFVLVICRRHGSARQLVCPSTQNKDSKPSESIYSPGPHVRTEPESKETDGVQYESLGDKVRKTSSRGVVTMERSLIKFYH